MKNRNMAMKMPKTGSIKDILEMFDENASLFYMLGSSIKDFTPIIEILELFVKQMKITREVSQEIKKELSDLNDEEFTKEAMKRLLPRAEPMQKKLQKMNDPDFNMMLFALPNKKGRRFFELMLELEEISKLTRKDPSKRDKIDSLINSFEQYVSEIKEISKPFVPAKINPNQTIVFKVAFKHRKGTWRKIELKATDTLEDLHDAIQDAIEWDNDHLYSFFMDNKFKNRDFDAEYTSPHEPEGRKTADEASVGIFGFSKCQKFAYLFDFGDMHKFEIEVLDFGNVDTKKKYPLILESKGKAPEQYRDYDDE